MSNAVHYGPQTLFAQTLHQDKYRQAGEEFRDYANRVANALSDSAEHFQLVKRALRDQRFLPGGRIQSSVGSMRRTTAINCFVSQDIEDDMASIMDGATRAAQTMRLGGGIGYDFSHLRPFGDRIRSLDSKASGPVSFMGIFDAVCQTIASAGHRRGAQMGVLRIDHPDILRFIHAKRNSNNLQGFNISVGVTDAFMTALKRGIMFPLTFNGQIYEMIDPRYLWDEIMRSTWDWAEPGVLFIDTINRMNNLWYCETIGATNPCGEQPLPANGACLLGSFNLVKYIVQDFVYGGIYFDYDQFKEDIPHIVRAMDNVIEETIYPLADQQAEQIYKRRMGLGVTGLANALEALGYPYASPAFLLEAEKIFATLRDEAYRESAFLAKEKGAFPAFKRDEYLRSQFIQTLPKDIQDLIAEYGIRNSHLLSMAPTGTISLAADNVSASIEPAFSLTLERTVQTMDGTKKEILKDYAYQTWGVKGRVADEISVQEHLDVLLLATKYVDSAVSKTCNVGSHVTFDEFKDIYLKAWEGGAKGVTTFRAAGKRFGILNVVKEGDESRAEACYIDPETGGKTCE
jgi:ribonucleoside-diphosphate reductase alpha chain